jgi:protein-tyrosine phosphatase
MFEVHKNLYIGSQQDCFYDNRSDWAVVHACKSPCHQRALNYRGSLPSTHPHYLVYERNNHLFLNIIDPPQPRFKLPLFVASLNFIQKHIPERKILIHCNLAYSRAPSIALLYLAKREKIIDATSFRSAVADFIKIFPYYQPQRGIVIYLEKNWEKLD